MIDLRQPSRSEAPHLQIELKRLGYEGRFQELRTLQQKAHRRSPISNEARSAVLSLSKMMLERHGYQVITASGPKEALHLFEVWPQIEVDLLMVDLVMPDMNGV